MFESCGIVTLLTDFGTRDGYVGALKGRILAHDRKLRVIDISHAIAPGDIRAGAYVLLQAAPLFPPGTVHCVVVDPGVGSDRSAVVVVHEGHLFVGPDNGVFGMVAPRPSQVYRIEAIALPAQVCQTFHGRDVFAPIAARLAAGEAVTEIGSVQRRLVALDIARPQRSRKADGRVQANGEVIHIDRFGNLITNIPACWVQEIQSDPAHVVTTLGGKRIEGVVRAFAAVKTGQPLVYPGSTGRIEVALRDGSAFAVLNTPRGTRVEMEWTEGPADKGGGLR